MRRLVAIVLLMLLPLQSIWAAAAPYCQHEATPTSAHPGHHTHEHHHHADADTASHGGETSPDQPPMQDHADCHVCHACSSPQGELTLRFQPPPAAATLGEAPAAGLPSPLASRPERPKWPALA